MIQLAVACDRHNVAVVATASTMNHGQCHHEMTVHEADALYTHRSASASWLLLLRRRRRRRGGAKESSHERIDHVHVRELGSSDGRSWRSLGSEKRGINNPHRTLTMVIILYLSKGTRL